MHQYLGPVLEPGTWCVVMSWTGEVLDAHWCCACDFAMNPVLHHGEENAVSAMRRSLPLPIPGVVNASTSTRVRHYRSSQDSTGNGDINGVCKDLLRYPHGP